MTNQWYIHKYEERQEYGGPEEGGWWFNVGIPVDTWHILTFQDEEMAYETCRILNQFEDERRKKDEKYEYTSVLSYKCTFFTYSVEDYAEPQAYPEYRPHYE